MSVETRLDAPVDVQRFARVFVKGPEELPSNADTYYDPEQGYYFKLHLDGVTSEEATPLISKARERFDVELVRRVSMDGFYKERVYVDDSSQVPDDKKVHEGPAGGIYYETGVEQVGVEESPETRNVAVIYWDDVELGDEIVYQTPEGEEIFAEIIDIENQPDKADVVIVDVEGQPQRASPGTYTVDDTEKAVGGRTMVWKAGDPNWVPYTGPRGGDGWRNPSTGEIVYQENPPDVAEGSDEETGENMLDDPDFDPSDPPDGGYAPGWEEPPEDETEIWPGQQVEVFLDGAYQYGEVEAVDEDRVQIEPDGSDEPIEVDLDEITAREDRDGTAVDTQPDPWSDVQRFEDDDVAQEFIDTVNEEPGEGFTFKRNLEVDNPFERDVWFVGITSKNLEAGEMDKEEIIDFYHEWLDLLEDEPSLHIGGYAFEDGGKVSIDLSVAVEDQEEAERLGEKFNQESIANLHLAEQTGWEEGFVPTGGTGESPVESEDDVREALEGIESLAKHLVVGKSKVFDSEKVYEVAGRRLTGTQVAYMALHGELDPTDVEMKPVEKKSNSALTSGTEGAHSVRYSPEDEDDEEDIGVGTPPRAEKADTAGHIEGPFFNGTSLRLEGDEVYCEESGEVYHINSDIESAEPLGECPGCEMDLSHLIKSTPRVYKFEKEAAWTYYVGPKGGEGWMNLETGEIRYQQKRPGPAPEGGDGYDDWVGEGWESPPEDLSDLKIGQPVEVNYDGKYLEAEMVEAGGELMAQHEDYGHFDISNPENPKYAEITAVGDPQSRHSGWFDDSKSFSEEEYWGAVEGEIPEDAPDEFQPFEIGQEVAVNLPSEDEPVSLPIYGYADSDSEFPVSEDSLVFHYDDLEEAIGTQSMFDNWGEPGETSPTISGPPSAVGNIILGPAEEHETQEDTTDEPEGSDGDGDPLYDAHWWTEDESVTVTPSETSDGTSGYEVVGGMYDGAWISEDDLEDLQPANEAAEEGYNEAIDEELGDVMPDENEGIPEGPLEGQTQTANDPDFDSSEYVDVPDVSIDSLPEGTDVIVGADGYYTTAEVYPSNIGYDPGDGSTLYPEDVEVEAVRQGAEDGLTGEESGEDPEAPDEEETSSAVAQPASEDQGGVHPAETEHYDIEEYDPSDVEEFRDMSDIGANHGNSVSAMQVAVLPDGSKAVHKDVSHSSVKEGDIKREMAGYEALKHLTDNVPGHKANIDEGWAVSEVAPGVDAKDATQTMKDRVSTEDFIEMAARQVIVGNSDLHQNNLRVDEDGNLYPFDLDRAGGDVLGDWTGNLSYENTLDRILGELEKSATALDVDTGYGFRETVIEKAEDIAYGLDGPEIMLIQEDAKAVDEELGETIARNIKALAEGEVNTP